MQEKEKLNWKELIEKLKEKFQNKTEALKEELKKIRTSRPSPALVEDLEVELFGQKFRLKNLAQITVLPPRQLKIEVWDKSYIDAILNALSKRDLGAAPQVSQNSILISLPPLSEEFRKNLIKIVGEIEQKIKREMREDREDCWRKIQRAFFEKKISEDEKYRAKNEIQKLVDEFNEKIEKIVEEKRQEILS